MALRGRCRRHTEHRFAQQHLHSTQRHRRNTWVRLCRHTRLDSIMLTVLTACRQPDFLFLTQTCLFFVTVYGFLHPSTCQPCRALPESQRCFSVRVCFWAANTSLKQRETAYRGACHLSCTGQHWSQVLGSGLWPQVLGHRCRTLPWFGGQLSSGDSG